MIVISRQAERFVSVKTGKRYDNCGFRAIPIGHEPCLKRTGDRAPMCWVSREVVGPDVAVTRGEKGESL